jgi:NAD(P)-dependent dehydrogenase (short-subunit alcohol dehydrogenase family)
MTETALVTGGAGNLGVEHAAALQDLGLHVILADLDLARLSSRVEAYSKLADNRLTLLEMDVTAESDIERVAGDVASAYGALSVLVNNAQGSHPGEDAPFEKLSAEAWRAVQDVNLTGTFLCCKHFGGAMAAAGSGSIINMSSLYGTYPPDFRIYDSVEFTNSAVYTASKAGLVGLTKYLAVYWAGSGVRVNAVSPGGVRIDHTDEFASAYGARVPLGRMASPDEIRGVISWLASDASSYVTGQNIFVDGGLSAW